jgi:hypothetical protein
VVNTTKENSMSDTPNFDETVETSDPAPQPVTDVAVDPADDPEVTPNTEPAPEFDGFHDEEDVDAALGRETEDGPGFGDESQLPAEDFDSFATDDVEVTE